MDTRYGSVLKKWAKPGNSYMFVNGYYQVLLGHEWKALTVRVPDLAQAYARDIQNRRGALGVPNPIIPYIVHQSFLAVSMLRVRIRGCRSRISKTSNSYTIHGYDSCLKSSLTPLAPTW